MAGHDDPRGMGADRASLVLRVADKIPAMLAYWDTSLRCRFANRAYERWFGVSPEALIGTHLRELLGPLYPLNLPYIEGALRGEPQEFDRQIPDPAGGPSRHSLASYIPDVIDGVVRGFVVVVTDVSKIRQAELALQESEARFSGIISISADAIISINEDHRITIFNRGAEKIFGYTMAEVTGGDLGMLLPARLRDLHRQHIATFLASDEVARPMGERRLVIMGLRKNGEEFPAEATISKLDVGGRILLTVALRDITERRRIEVEQQILAEAGSVLASSRNYKQTLESIARLMVRHVADLCIIDMIEDDLSVLRLTVTHADPAKAPLGEALAAMTLDMRHILARSSIETKQPKIFDDLTTEFITSTAQDATHLRLLLELAPKSAITVPLLAAGRVLGALVLASSRSHHYGGRDIAFVVELARRAALAVENARLYEAEQRATQERDKVLGIVAHDVRSPLNSILLATNFLGQQIAEHAEAAAQKSVQIVQRSVRRAARLIEDLLDVTRMEAGALSLVREALSAREVLADASGSQRMLATAASIELRVETNEKLVEIWADRHRLLQVLENLIGNAIKFTPQGGQIILGAAPGRDEVVFSVADTGPGIDAENLPHIFDRFWQVRRTERGGAGLGLAICKGIVEAHGGRIWAESMPGRGSTFFFALPAVSGASA